MKHLKIWILLFTGFFATNAGNLFAQTKPEYEVPFKKALTALQAALNQNSPDKVAELCAFPKFFWETPDLGDDLPRDVFTKNFQKMFTPEIRQKIKTGKFQQNPMSGDYVQEWNKKYDNYILIFVRQTDGSYKFGGLAVGPADPQG